MEAQPSKEPILIVERVMGEMVIKNLKIIPQFVYPEVTEIPPKKTDT